MKHTRTFVRIALAAILCLLTVAFCACNNTQDEPDESETLPATIETLPVTDPAGDVTEAPTDAEAVTEPETEPETLPPSIYANRFDPQNLPDYADYISESRIPQVLKDLNCVVVADGASYVYRNETMKDCNTGLAEKVDGMLTVDAAELASYFGKTVDLDGYVNVQEAANALKCFMLLYDNKLAVFYYGTTTLDNYDDMYTLEAMYLRLTEADETELVNAFIDLPDAVSNGRTNTVFYTSPDLNLGIQSSVYFAQLGGVDGIDYGPCLVAGEGKWDGDDKNPANHTVVKVMNQQQTVTAQFLAFDASVTGGVQVAAAKVGGQSLIACCPFALYTGKDGDIRVFDSFGTLRMDIYLRDIVSGPFTILTGRFDPTREDELLLIMSAKLDADGMMDYIMIDLATGEVITRTKLNCDFAKGTGEYTASVRAASDGTADTVILYFHEIHAVYEGRADKAEFNNTGITPPSYATGVYASANLGEKYIITIPETEENKSYITVYDTDGNNGGLLDVGFRENVFYTAYYWNDNWDTYVSKGEFNHIRCDLSNGVMNKLNNAGTSAAVDKVFDNAKYTDYAFNAKGYADKLAKSHQFFEPCFTHRWNKISGTTNLTNYIDSDTGERLYVSVGNTGEYTDYLELGSSFYIGTYADGILDLAKLRLFPLRSFLRGTVNAFRGEDGTPENLVGVSPVHEHEIDVAGTVGDYNIRMVRGFGIYLMELYGSVENINARFGTEFTDEYEIDPPRDTGRGDWDKYDGAYFTEWILYNRTIVSKRIMEAYREALCAGYPPESISAHSIPEGDAVAGFLGEADTRISPIDVITTCGTAYGGTRYGNFYSMRTNFFNIANRAGHWSISLGEYSSLETNANAAYKQLEWLWSHGLRMVHFITFNDQQAKAEKGAVEKLAEKNEPRPGYVGGTTSLAGVIQGGKTYNIIQMGEGEGSDNQGLLKSVAADGTWEGTVYVVPFHAHVNIYEITALQTAAEGNAYLYSTGKLSELTDYLKNSDMVEVSCKAAYSGEGKAYMTIAVYNHGCMMPASETTYELTASLTPYRFCLNNQLYMEDVEIRVTFTTEGGDNAGITVQDMYGVIMQDAVCVKYFDKGPRNYMNSLAHYGGVTFDILDRDMRG